MTTFPSGVTMMVGSTVVVGSDIEGLITSSETPGGYREAKWSHAGGLGELPFDITDRVLIHDANWNRWPFIGRVQQITKRGLCYEITAGRSTADRAYTRLSTTDDVLHPSGLTSTKKYTAGTRFYVALTDALALCEDVFDGGIIDPGFQFVADTNDLGLQTAEQIWNYISSLTNGFETPLMWHIRGQNGVEAVVIDFQDTAGRYFVRLDEEQIEETLSSLAIVNEVGVSYGNGQIAYAPADGIISYSVLKNIRTKTINAQNSVSRFPEAQALAEAHLQRYGQRRTINDVLTMHCDKDLVRVVPPAYDYPVDDWPLWLVESGWSVYLKDRAPGLLRDKYITGGEYQWDDGLLTARCGEVTSLFSQQIGVEDYNVNRLFNGPYNGPPGGNHPLADADLYPKVGSEVDASSPPSTSYGVPGFKAAVSEDDSEVKYGKQLDPDIVPDEGLEANINFDPSSTGYQAAVRTTPGTYNQYRLLLGDSTGLVGDTVVAEFYRIIPITENPLGGQQFLFRVESNGQKDRTVAIPSVVLKRGDFVMIRVTAQTNIASWAAVSLHAKKNFPRLKS